MIEKYVLKKENSKIETLQNREQTTDKNEKSPHRHRLVLAIAI
jgi:hypothetical protein